MLGFFFFFFVFDRFLALADVVVRLFLSQYRLTPGIAEQLPAKTCRDENVKSGDMSVTSFHKVM